MDKSAQTTQKLDVTQEEMAIILKMRNKRTVGYNLRVSEKENEFLNALQKEIEAAGTHLESKTDFILHCGKAVATLTKSQLKLV